MARKNSLNPFSLSFLDLLSGTLAAVVLLFIVTKRNPPLVDTPKIAYPDTLCISQNLRDIRQYVPDSLHQKLVVCLDDLLTNVDSMRYAIATKDSIIRAIVMQLDSCRQQLVFCERRECFPRCRKPHCGEDCTNGKPCPPSCSRKHCDEDCRDNPPVVKQDSIPIPNPWKERLRVQLSWAVNADVDLYVHHKESGKWAYWDNKTGGGIFTEFKEGRPGRKDKSKLFSEVLSNKGAADPGTYEIWAFLDDRRRAPDDVQVTCEISLTDRNFNLWPRNRIKTNTIRVPKSKNSPKEGGGKKLLTFKIEGDQIKKL